MSWSIDLFVDAHEPLPQFVRDVEVACDIKFTKFCSDEGERYEYHAPMALSACGTITPSKMTVTSTSQTIAMK